VQEKIRLVRQKLKKTKNRRNKIAGHETQYGWGRIHGWAGGVGGGEWGGGGGGVLGGGFGGGWGGGGGGVGGLVFTKKTKKKKNKNNKTPNTKKQNPQTKKTPKKKETQTQTKNRLRSKPRRDHPITIDSCKGVLTNSPKGRLCFKYPKLSINRIKKNSKIKALLTSVLRTRLGDPYPAKKE